METYDHHTPWLHFAVEDDSFVIPLEVVAEVTDATPPRLIPLVSMGIGGILNFRGEPLPTVDGALLLQDRPSLLHEHMLVLREGALRIGVLVGRVSRIERGLSVDAAGEEDEGGTSYVRWIQYEESRLGLVDPKGLLAQATEVLAGNRFEGRVDLWHNAF